MKISAYVMVADPWWIEASVLSYYSIIDRLLVSYDVSKRGWTGAPIAVDECISRLRAIDRDGKMELLGDQYVRPDLRPLDAETAQRQAAMDHLAGADWILALDTDELIPDAAKFKRRLVEEIPPEYDTVEYPLRTFFNVTEDGRLLEICGRFGKRASDLVPVAYRRALKLSAARRSQEAKLWQYRVWHWSRDLRPGMRRAQAHLPVGDAILHLSWLRSEDGIRQKTESWGHARDFDARNFVETVWKRARHDWPRQRNVHPIWPTMWSRLRPAEFNVAALLSSPADLEAMGVRL